MLGIADFEFSNHCDVYVDLAVEDVVQKVPFTVTSMDGVLTVRDIQGDGPVEVMDVMGRRVSYQPNHGTSVQMAVPTRGVYVVRVGQASSKVVVR